MTNGKVMRIRPELFEALKRDVKINFSGVNPRLAQILAQKKAASILNQTHEMFKIPKYKSEIDLKKCQLKRIM